MSNINRSRTSLVANFATIFFIVVLITIAGTGTITATDYSSGGDFVAGPAMNVARMAHNSATLPDGRVLLLGGHGAGFTALDSAELWTGSSFTPLTMNAPHDGGAIALLPSGEILIAGGADDLGVAPGNNASEIFSTVDNTFTPSGSLNYSRTNARAATLTSGKVLVVGGWYDANSPNQAELYDPSSGSFTLTGFVHTPRSMPVVLPTADNKAVVIGGSGPYGTPNCVETVELYDATTNLFTLYKGTLFTGESGWCVYGNSYTAPIEEQLMPDGRYLLLATRTISGSEWENTLFTFDPETRLFEKLTTYPGLPNSPASLSGWRPLVDHANGVAYLHGAVAGSNPYELNLYTLDLATGHLQVPAGTYTLTGYFDDAASLALLQDGRILIAGGTTAHDYYFNFNAVPNSLLVTPAHASPGGVFVTGPAMNTARMSHLAITRPGDPRLWVFGGHGSGFIALDAAEVGTADGGWGSFTMNAPHDGGAIARLADGRVLLAGGSFDGGGHPGYNVAEIFNPADNTFTLTGAMTYGRTNTRAATLADGRVLVVGGWYEPNSPTYAELYDPGTGTFTVTGPLNTPRSSPVVLPTTDNRAVVFGGNPYWGGAGYETVEIYNPVTNTFTPYQDSLFPTDPGWFIYGGVYTGPMEDQRLADGRYLLLASRASADTPVSTLFTFDPDTLALEKVTTVPSLPTAM